MERPKIRIKPKLSQEDTSSQATIRNISQNQTNESQNIKQKIKNKNKNEQITVNTKSQVYLRFFKDTHEMNLQKLVFELSDSDLSQHSQKCEKFNITSDSH
ncbi:hypothetical protein SS50377_21818 [Spironucleus salmonicida]|uniref:Uncharacterized protein n=1 Tax=Spironucleus salmonicida TaxID=348837 RepID=A0A9P8LXP0_9EUKA|nr:hypothetical protein SS50377_21818 [Spironucleus salmonicida]